STGGQERSRRWPQVGPVQPEILPHLVGPGPNRVMELAALGLGRAFQYVAVDVVEPAVVGAGDAPLLDSAVQQQAPRWTQWSWISPTWPLRSFHSTRSSHRMRTCLVGASAVSS